MWTPMPSALAGYLLDEARLAAPEEMCGFVVVNWGIVPIRNVAPNPTAEFEMEPRGMLDVLTTGMESTLGVYHSHPGGRALPSEHDVDLMRVYPEWRYWIVTPDNVYEWRLENDRACSVRHDGTTGGPDVADPILAASAEVRRAD